MLIMYYVTEFPAGDVAITLYSGGVMKGSTHLLYYNSMGEISRLLKQTADPMNFMCQVRKQLGTLDYTSTGEVITS